MTQIALMEPRVGSTIALVDTSSIGVLSSGMEQEPLVVRRSAGKRKDAGSTPSFGSPFSSKIVIYGHCLVTLPCTITETLKGLTLPVHLNAELILGDDSVAVIYQLPLPPPLLLLRYHFCEPDVKLD